MKTNKQTQSVADLERYAAESIMGWCVSVKNPEVYINKTEDNFITEVGSRVKNWNPSKDANQLDQIEAELVKLGMWFVYEVGNYPYTYTVNIRWHRNESVLLSTTGSQKETRLKAYCEAFKKFMEATA